MYFYSKLPIFPTLCSLYCSVSCINSELLHCGISVCSYLLYSILITPTLCLYVLKSKCFVTRNICEWTKQHSLCMYGLLLCYEPSPNVINLLCLTAHQCYCCYRAESVCTSSISSSCSINPCRFYFAKRQLVLITTTLLASEDITHQNWGKNSCSCI